MKMARIGIHGHYTKTKSITIFPQKFSFRLQQYVCNCVYVSVCMQLLKYSSDACFKTSSDIRMRCNKDNRNSDLTPSAEA